MASETFKIGDRVVRLDSEGPAGTVEKVREEIVRETIKQDENEPLAVTVTVRWDNGTLSHFVPDSLRRLE